MSEIDDNTQANVALTLEEKITDRVRKALVEVLMRGNKDHYVQDMIDQRIRADLETILNDPYKLKFNTAFLMAVQAIVKEFMVEQMRK